MKMLFGLICIAIGGGLIGGAIGHYLGRTSVVAAVIPVTPPAEQVSAAEVSDLLARLKPLVKEPNGAWYSNGLTLTFYGNGDAKLELKMPNGNVLAGMAHGLNAVVDQVAHPSPEIGAALDGWQK